MRVYCAAGVTVALAATLSGGVGATWATAQVPRTQTEFGGPVYPAYEGWRISYVGSQTCQGQTPDSPHRCSLRRDGDTSQVLV